MAYVLAHEIGHHVQNLLGLLPQVRDARRAMEEEDAKALQMRLELQADCFAGVWANRALQKWQPIEADDIKAALQAASAVGEDRLQRRPQGHIVPDAFVHGSQERRIRWYMAGFKSGNVSSCDTFRTQEL